MISRQYDVQKDIMSAGLFVALHNIPLLETNSLDLLLVVYKRIMLRLRGSVYVFISTFVSGLPPGQFHGRTQPSNLDSFFERAVSLVREVMRLADTAENQEDVLEYCISRLENLLSNCVNLFGLVNEELYNRLIDSVQQYIILLRHTNRTSRSERESSELSVQRTTSSLFHWTTTICSHV